MSTTTVLHDHLWMDIFQHTQRSFFGCENKRVWKYRHNLLINASMYGSSSVVRLLLASGANVNYTDDQGWTALAWASQSGNSDMVRMLLTAGANVNQVNIHGWTALAWASYRGYIDIVRMLLEAGAKVNIDESLPLMWAIPITFARNHEITKILNDAAYGSMCY